MLVGNGLENKNYSPDSVLEYNLLEVWNNSVTPKIATQNNRRYVADVLYYMFQLLMGVSHLDQVPHYYLPPLYLVVKGLLVTTKISTVNNT